VDLPDTPREVPECSLLLPQDITYPIGYYGWVSAEHLLVRARQAAGLSQAALAKLAGTSRPTLSAYEHGRKAPTLETAVRIIGEAGFELSLTSRIDFHEATVDRGRPILVPNTLPRLPLEDAFAVVQLPLHLNWSDRGRRFDLLDRRQRARVYELVLREGRPSDVLTYLDGALLVDLWNELVLPVAVRAAWSGVVTGQDKDTGTEGYFSSLRVEPEE
jgi:transcriptional regulator with XRE-family HTH domain